MSADALQSSAISKIREEVPEFESTFQSALSDEGGEIGSFQAISIFAGWLTERMYRDSRAPEVRRSFSVIEQIAGSATFPMGRALVTEFVEAIDGSPEALGRLGPASRVYRDAP